MIQMLPVGAAVADSDDDDFLSRWSRRKRSGHPEQAPDDSSGDSPNEDATPEAEGDPEVVAQLPDIDGMDDASDFSVFLKAGVPEPLRRRALRKLWRINPVLANLDGLNDYDEDYTQMSALGQGLKTLYKVGKGFATDDSEAVADGGPPPDAPDDSETQSSELPPPNEPEPQVDTVKMALDRADAQPVESAPKRKHTARNRRWGTSKTPS